MYFSELLGMHVMLPWIWEITCVNKVIVIASQILDDHWDGGGL